MFNIGPMELLVLGIVALLVLGPDKLPGFVRDAVRMIRTLRELATGARDQLRDELGPDFADVDLRNLNPKTAITRAVFGDEMPDLGKYNPRNFDAKTAGRDFIFGKDAPADGPVSMTKPAADGPSRTPNGSAAPARPRPRPRPAAQPSRYDDIA